MISTSAPSIAGALLAFPIAIISKASLYYTGEATSVVLSAIKLECATFALF